MGFTSFSTCSSIGKVLVAARILYWSIPTEVTRMTNALRKRKLTKSDKKATIVHIGQRAMALRD